MEIVSAAKIKNMNDNWVSKEGRWTRQLLPILGLYSRISLKELRRTTNNFVLLAYIRAEYSSEHYIMKVRK